jgi:hypothetical protein
MVATAILATGCMTAYRGTFLDDKHAMHFKACPSDEISDPKAHAHDALIASLASLDWVLEPVSRTDGVVARKCDISSLEGDPLKADTNKCLIVRFSFWATGDIIAINPREQRMSSYIANFSEEWMNRLEREYAELRCYSKEELERWGAKHQGVRQ